MTITKTIRLSPSALNLYKDCQRCFWLDKVKNIRRPRGIFPSLPNGMDRVIKDYFDSYRQKGEMPPEFNAKSFDGLLPYDNQRQLDLWRDWKTGPQFVDDDESILFGAVDDLMVKDGKHVTFDYKTKGTPTTVEAAKKYYTTQLECYSLMLEATGLPQAGYGYLMYYSPKQTREKGWVLFNLQAIRIDTDVNRAKALFREAVALLRQPEIPHRTDCEYCQWASNVLNNKELFAS